MTTLSPVKFIAACFSVILRNQRDTFSPTFVTSFLLWSHEFQPEHFIYRAQSQRFVSTGSRLFLSPQPLISLRISQPDTISLM